MSAPQQPDFAESVTPDVPGSHAVLFDMDGVLTDTAALHYQSWKTLTDELGIPFDSRRNDALRGLRRAESLAVILGARVDEFTAEERQALLDRKQAAYLASLEQFGPEQAFPGTRTLIEALRGSGWRTAVASASQNAGEVIARLDLTDLFDAIVDARSTTNSKPHPEIFLTAAEAVGVEPARCVVVEDGAAGVAAARAGGMRVIGVGPAAQRDDVDFAAPSISSLTTDVFVRMLE